MTCVIKRRNYECYVNCDGDVIADRSSAARFDTVAEAAEFADDYELTLAGYKIVRLVKRPKSAAKTAEHVVEVREECGQYPWHRIYINGHPITAYTRAELANEIADRIRRALADK